MDCTVLRHTHTTYPPTVHRRLPEIRGSEKESNLARQLSQLFTITILRILERFEEARR
jgi:hypothetical protein